MHLEGYELLDLAMEGGVQVTRLREQKSGNLFQLHAFHGDMVREFDELTRELPSIPPNVSRVVKVSRERGSGYILTELLPEDVSIQAWIGRLRDTPPAPAQSPSLSRTSVDSLRRLAMEPGALKPLLPGPDKPASGPVPRPEAEPADGEGERVFRRAKELKERRQGGTPDAAGSGSPASRPADPRRGEPPAMPLRPVAGVPSSRTESPSSPAEAVPAADKRGEFTELIEKRKAARGSAPRAEPVPAPSHNPDRPPPMRNPEPPPKPVEPQLNRPGEPLPIETSAPPAASDGPGLGTWLKPIPKGPAEAAPRGAVVTPPASPPHPYQAPLPPEPEDELPIPPAPRPKHVDFPREAASPRVYRTPGVPPQYVAKPPVTLPPPRPQESAWSLATEWRPIAWTVGGLVVVLAVVLWIVEKAG